MLLAARICRAGVSPGLTSFVRTPIVSTTPQFSKGQIARLFVSDGRSSYTRTARKKATVTEQAMAPAGQTGKLCNIFIFDISMHESHSCFTNSIVF